MEFFLLLIAGFAAGFIDAVAGGGGLVQLPALLLLFPGLPPAATLSANKVASFSGSFAASLTYLRKVKIDWVVVRISIIGAVIFSALGAALVDHLPTSMFRPVVSILLIVAALRIARLRPSSNPLAIRARPSWKMLVCASGIAGLYDGFFGPGTGTLLIYLLVTWLSFDFLSASATAKFINLGTNAGAIIYFGCSGSIDIRFALPLAAANVLGGIVGARTAIKNGTDFVQRVVLGMVLVVAAKVLLEFLSN